MKRCPKCMTKTEGKYCPDCGYDMSLVSEFVCPNCGCETETEFCPNCGTKVRDVTNETASTEVKDTTASNTPENGVSPIKDEIEKSNVINNIGIEDSGAISIEAASENMAGNKGSKFKDIWEDMKKRPMVLGAVALVLVLVVMIAMGSSGGSGNTSSSNTSSDTSSSTYSSDDTYSSDNSYSSSGSSYSEDDGLNLIQGTWKLQGVVTDGEATNVAGYSFATLVISGDRWDLTITTDETTHNSGPIYHDLTSQQDDGSSYYLYTLKSDSLTGSVKMAYDSGDDFIAVSTKDYLDADNSMYFGR